MITPGVRGSVCIIYFAYCNLSQPVRAVQVASPPPLGFLYICGVELGGVPVTSSAPSWKQLRV